MLPLRPHLVTDADTVDTVDTADLDRTLVDRLARIADEDPIEYLPMTDDFYDHSIALHDHVSPGIEGTAAHRVCARD
ncbi:hypothetical protein ABFT43_11515 [Gordonia sp. B21]